MPHQFLQGKDVDTVPQHIDGKSSSKIMEIGFLFKSCFFGPSLEDLVQTIIRSAVPAVVYETHEVKISSLHGICIMFLKWRIPQIAVFSGGEASVRSACS